MRPDELEDRMRRLECFHAIKCPPGSWVILRLDGRGFSRFTEAHCEKPFDRLFHEWMVSTTQAVFEEFSGLYAYTESDEISILFPREWELFDREIEKLLSLSAGLASATFAISCGAVASFDARIILAATDDQVIDYFRWRQADATRCALNGWCYWTIRKAGQSVQQATKALDGASVGDKNEMLFQHGINFNNVPLWQRRGCALYWEEYAHQGHNPILNQPVMTTRRRIKVDRELPMSDEYTTFMQGFVTASAV